MRYLITLASVCCTSLILYFFVFGFLIFRPLVVNEVGTLLSHKIAYAATLPSPKLAIIAGSNARFSHSCAEISHLVGWPCVNMGVTAEAGIDWVIDSIKPFLKPGDAVYLPIEYETYSQSRAQMFTGMDAAYRFRFDKYSLLSRGPEGILKAAFMFSLPTLVQSLGEMLLSVAHVRRRQGVDTTDIEGDEIGHTAANAHEYEKSIDQATFVFPRELFANPAGAQEVIADFLDWCRAHHVTAIGGLPTTLSGGILPAAGLDELGQFYRKHGADFLVLANHSQYPRRYFFDNGYHLRQARQIEHSALLAAALRPLLVKK